MNLRCFAAILLAAIPLLAGAEDPARTSSNAREMLRARLEEEARQNAAKPPPAQSPAKPAATAPAMAARDEAKNPIVAASPPPPATEAKPTDRKPEPATVLPKVEVRKGRITELDQQLARQDEAIAREKRNAKPSEVDKALNDSRIAKPLSILGGESAQYRQRVASERVSLMEDEKDLIEAIAHAKTKEEKAGLQKQLDVLRAERRELEKALR